MTGQWKGGLALGNATAIGVVTATSTGTLITGSGSTFTKSAWAQLTASTASDLDWLLVSAESTTTGGTAFAIDVGIGGAGSETVILANLNYSDPVGGANNYFLPVSIPAGTRVAARMSSGNAGDTFRILLHGFEDTYHSAGSGSAVDTYGFSTLTNLGTAVDPGATANTKGAYSQIVSSTTNDLAGFIVIIDAQDHTTGSVGTIQWLLDVAVGASGSEVIILPNLYQIGFAAAGGINLMIQQQTYYPIPILAGTRIAIRAQCSVNTASDRLLGITIYGVRL